MWITVDKRSFHGDTRMTNFIYFFFLLNNLEAYKFYASERRISRDKKKLY